LISLRARMSRSVTPVNSISTTPPTHSPSTLHYTSSTVPPYHAKLEEDGALSVTITAYQGLLKQFSLRRDGYKKVLKEIMRPFIPTSQQPAMLANIPPTLGPPECLNLTSDLSTYFELQLHSDRFFTLFEQSQIYLDGLKTNVKYRATATTLLHRLYLQGLPLPPTLHLDDIPGTVTAEHLLSTPTPAPAATATIHAAQASCPSGYNRSGPPRGAPGSDRRPQQRLECKNCQCKACGLHGHEHPDCNLLPRVINCIEYHDSHPTQCKDAVHRSLARSTTQRCEQNVRETEKNGESLPYLRYGYQPDRQRRCSRPMLQ